MEQKINGTAFCILFYLLAVFFLISIKVLDDENNYPGQALDKFFVGIICIACVFVMIYAGVNT